MGPRNCWLSTPAGAPARRAAGGVPHLIKAPAIDQFAAAAIAAAARWLDLGSWKSALWPPKLIRGRNNVDSTGDMIL